MRDFSGVLPGGSDTVTIILSAPAFDGTISQVTTQQGRDADTVIDTSVTQDSVTFVKADGERNGTRTVTFDPATLASEVTDLLQDELEEIYMIVSQPNDTTCLLYTSPSPRDRQKSRMPSSA